MIALLTTYFLIFYILIPGVIFRFASSLRVRLKLFQRTRTQEATFAVAVALVPFALALLSVWYVPVLKEYPFHISAATLSEGRQDYHRVAGLFTSAETSKLLDSRSPDSKQLDASPPPASRPAAADTTWHSLNRVLRRQGRFLCWYFVFTAAEGLLFGFLASKYGDWQQTQQEPVSSHKQTLRRFLLRIYNRVAPVLILPNISEWHILLTNFNWPKQKSLFVVADVLQNDGNLYKGRVVDYFIDADGKLSGILLKEVVRFDRHTYEAARKIAPNADAILPDDFWKNIPSRNFYIGQDSISNLNVRFALEKDKDLVRMTDQVLQEEDLFQDYAIVESRDDAPDTHRNPPDLYS